MVFAKQLRERICRGEITRTVRIWQRCHVKVGGRYRMGDGRVVVTPVSPISLQDITGSLARQCGFNGTVDLLKVAQHGPGRNVFVIDFRYENNRT
ncbi:MAG: ASCH domain-containing protein [Gammaproteobacteria bacterium]